MGDDMRQDEPGMKPDGIRLRAKDDSEDDTEGHGGGKWAGAKDEMPDQPGSDADAPDDTEGHGGGWWNGAKEGAPDEPADGTPGPDGIARWSDINRKQAIVPVRW